MKFFTFFLSLIFAGSALYVSPAKANFESGNSLYNDCLVEKGNSLFYQKRIRCLSYIVGVYDTFDTVSRMQNAPSVVCAPSGIVVEQLSDIVLAYLRANPEVRHYPAADIVMLAFSKSFPCRKAQ
jgi:hypothetical protein